MELAKFLRAPENANASEQVLDDVLDEMDAIWYSLEDSDYELIDKLVKQLK